MGQPTDSIVRSDRLASREGVTTGVVGAAAVAVFYFILDVIRGRPLMTPTVLGEVLVLHTPITTTPDPAAVVVYTLAHGIAFIAMGLLFTLLIRAAEQSVLARYGVVQLAVVFELFFYGLLSIAAHEAEGMFPFVGVLAANTIALVAMAAWYWRHHPVLRAAFHRQPLGSIDEAHPNQATSARRP